MNNKEVFYKLAGVLCIIIALVLWASGLQFGAFISFMVGFVFGTLARKEEEKRGQKPLF